MAALAAAGTVAAQSSVTMYGRVNTGAYYQKKTETLSGTKTTTTTSGFRNNPAGGGTSRLGFKGSEALGNGLSATFQLEMGFCGATGVFSPGETSVGFNRGATVGFKGAFGEVKVGYSGDPFFNFDGSYKAIDNTSAFDNRVKTASGKNAEYRGRHPGIFYSGTFSDVTVEASVGHSGENKKETGKPDTKTNRSTYGLGLGYASGPLAVGAAVQFDKDKGTTDTTTTSYGIGATYDFNVAKQYAQYKGGRVKMIQVLPSTKPITTNMQLVSAHHLAPQLLRPNMVTTKVNKPMMLQRPLTTAMYSLLEHSTNSASAPASMRVPLKMPTGKLKAVSPKAIKATPVTLVLA